MSEVIDKSIRLLYALIPNEHETEWSATKLSKQLDMPVQTVHRLLSSLAEHGFVFKNKETRKFRLGLTLMQLGLMIWENMSVRNSAMPIMERLAKQTKESIYLTVREGNYGVFVDCVDSPQMLKIAEPIGMKLPLCKGASKKVIFAFLPKKLQQQIIKELSMELILTDEDKDKLDKELMFIRKKGYAVSIGETTEGTVGIAAPIFTWDNQIIGSISIAGPETRFKAARIKEMIDAAKKSSVEISEQLGWIKLK